MMQGQAGLSSAASDAREGSTGCSPEAQSHLRTLCMLTSCMAGAWLLLPWRGTCTQNEGSPPALSQSWKHIQPQKIDQSLYLLV